MTERVLLVDDEANVLDGLRRQLRKKVNVETAESGAEGLQKVRDLGPFAVVVSDMRMPQMNGAEFLSQVRAIAPDTVRMILSGQAELESTIAAVNDGHIFRFLTKPCPAESLGSALDAGLEQHRLVRAERDLLEKTLSGAVRTLTEILGVTNPVAYSRASRIQRYSKDLVIALGIKGRWQFGLAGMLSQIGCITLPADTLSRKFSGLALTAEEEAVYAAHPQLAGKLLGSIPRLETVAEIVARQMETVDWSSLPAELKEWDTGTLGALILRAATAIDDLITAGMAPDTALSTLEQQADALPDQLRSVLHKVQVNKEKAEKKTAKVSDLVIGMILDEDIMSTNGMRLIPRGQEVTQTILLRLRSIAAGVGIVEPFRVTVLR